MEPLFLTDKTKILLPIIKQFVQKELVPLETAAFLTGKFTNVEPFLKEKREMVKQAGLWSLQQHWSSLFNSKCCRDDL